MLLEPDELRDERIAAVERGISSAFAAAVAHLGEEKARSAFRTIAKGKRGRRAATATYRDEQLLVELALARERVELALARERKESTAKLAKRLHDLHPELGNSDNALAVRIRRLERRWKKALRADRRASARWRWSTRRLPPSLLEQ